MPFCFVRLLFDFSLFALCSVTLKRSFLGVRSEFIQNFFDLLRLQKSPNTLLCISCSRILIARVIVLQNSNCCLIAICNKYCHLRSCFAYSCNPSTFRLYALKLHLFPPFQLCMQNATICNSKVAIHEETSSFFKFCLYIPNVKFWRYIQENTRFS